MNTPNDPDRDPLGLDAFDAVEAPDQWDEIVSRAASPTSNVVPLQRSATPWILAAAAAALVVVAVAALAVRGGGGELPAPATVPGGTLAAPDTVSGADPDDTVPTTDVVSTTLPATGVATTAPPTTAVPSSTVASTSVPTTEPQSTASVAFDAWTPVCADVSGAGAVPASALDPLAALGDAPTLDIGLPTFDGFNGSEAPIVDVAEVPGGVLVVARADLPQEPFGGVAALAVVDLDGSIRWRRCLATDGVFGYRALVADRAAETAWIQVVAPPGPAELIGFDLATGAALDPIDVGSRAFGRVQGEWVVATADGTQSTIEDPDRLLLIRALPDRLSVQELPYPAATVGRPVSSTYIDIDVDADIDGGGVMISAVDFDDARSIAAVWSEETGWTTDPEDIRRLSPTLRLPVGAEGLEFLDATGEPIWTVPDFRAPSREGFVSLVTDDVVVAIECASWTEENGCAWLDDVTPPTERTVAFDRMTGEELWSVDTSRPVIELAAGRALMLDDTDDDGTLDIWRVVDLRTAEPVDGTPTWPSLGSFANECCGAGDYVWTRVDGNVFVESLGDRLRIWLAPESSRPTATVDLMG